MGRKKLQIGVEKRLGEPVKVTWWPQKGIYCKVIGEIETAWTEVDDDVYAPAKVVAKKFYLGSDKTKAEIAAGRLQLLWHEIRSQGHAWNTHSIYLELADAIRQGRHVYEVLPPGPPTLPSPDAGLAYVAQLNRAHKSIQIMASQEMVRQAAIIQLQKAGQGFPASQSLPFPNSVGGGFLSPMGIAHEQQSGWRLETALVSTMSNMAVLPAASSSKTVHQALEAFSLHLRDTNLARGGGERKTSEHGYRIADCVERLKDSMADRLLSAFGFDAILACTSYWKSRPHRKGTTTPIAPDTVEGEIKALRRFVEWLDATDSFEWAAPKNWKRATAFRKNDVLDEREQKALARGNRAKSYTIDELVVLYKYTTRWEQLFVLLGLNFGFAQAEIQSLKVDEIDLVNRRIERVRRKKGVFSKFLIWPETVELLEWALARRKKLVRDVKGQDITVTSDSYLVLTDNGQPIYRLTNAGNRSDSVANAWNTLIKRVRIDHPGFRRLGFKFLRKTAGNLVRQVSDGEVAGTFHSRANVVKTDDEADAYTSRPYEKVFAAQEKVREMLMPVFAARPSEGSTVAVGSTGRNIGIKKMEEIQAMISEHKSVREIADKLNIAISTVYKYMPKETEGSPEPD